MPLLQNGCNRVRFLSQFDYQSECHCSKTSELPPKEAYYKKEIDAQRYLLDVAKRYKIPRIEIEQTKGALQGYLEELKELTGEDY